MSEEMGVGCEGVARGRKRANRRVKLGMRKRQPASEAGFFAVADRVGRRRREEFAAVVGENRKTIIGRGWSFMGPDLWERVVRAG
jgi:hypothetical protein